MLISRDRICRQNEFLSRLQLDESILDDANADLRPLQILKNRHGLVQRFTDPLDLPHKLALVLRRSMREIETGHVHPGHDQLRDHLFGIGRWTDGTNNLCSSHHFLESSLVALRAPTSLVALRAPTFPIS